MAQEKGRDEIELVSEEEGRKYVQETFADPDAAGRLFDELIETRKGALEGFAKQLNGDEELAQQFARRPLELLHERKLLGPLDQITLEGLRNPFVDFPWPWPRCRVVCRLEFVTHVHWVCVGFWPLRFCWPVFHVHVRWVCRIVCD